MKELNLMQRKEILSLKRDDVDKNLIIDWFTSSNFESEPKFSPQDTFTLPRGELFNDEPIKTTVGRFLTNLFVFPKRFLAKKRYVNEPLTVKTYGALENEMGIMVFNGEMPEEEYIEYMNNAVWLFMGQAYIFNSSMSQTIIQPIPEVIELRDKLFEQHRTKLDDGDSATIDMIENTLVDMAKEILDTSDDPSLDYYRSGVASLDNAYKKTAIMVGAVKNPSTNKIRMIKSNFTDGLKKDEYSDASHLTAAGGYARTEGTKMSGYSTKKYLNTTVGMVLGEPGSDCWLNSKTQHTMTIKLENNNYNSFIDRYIVENGKLILLDYKAIKKYIGQTVMMRSPMFCQSDKICSKCAGEHFYRMGVRNAGVHINSLGGRLLNLGLKKFHDSSVKYQTINIEDFIT